MSLDIGRLTAPVNRLPGVAEGRAGRLAHLLGRASAAETRVFDLLNHMPTSVVDRRRRVQVAEAPEAGVATFTVRVVGHRKSPSPRGPVRVDAEDETGRLAIVFFRGGLKWLQGAFPVGAWVRISGEVTWRDGAPQLVHPDVYALVDGPHAPVGAAFGLAPVYPMTQGLTPGVLAGLTAAAVERIGTVPEWLDPAFAKREALPAFADAYRMVHRPAEPGEALPGSPARRRIAYDELLASQLAHTVVRDRERATAGRARAWDAAAVERIEASLPFTLTPSQRLTLAEIAADLASPNRMVRLVQGDVGSGKTAVAMIAAAMVAGSGGQTAMMAPTDLVARQHFETFARTLEPHGLGVRLLTGRVGEKARAEALADVSEGRAAVAVGTHALFQKGVAFADLALAVVDEQHRFGVAQRMALSEKGERADLLVMTATPIPRTLVLASYGDMDVSRLTDKPAGRQPVETRAVSLAQLDEVVDRLAAALERGEKAYWVCPLVEAGAGDQTAAVERHARLTERLGPRVGLVHGRTPNAERERVMGAFRDGSLAVLVATTVVEVGVDVPDATIMVIENAEGFGLSQLHQLRGRVGRGARRSTCLLLYRPPLGAVARRRLDTMRATNDGFQIAEDDLKLRGEGELLGTRQSGAPQFRVADLDRDGDLLAAAADDARLVVARDPSLTSDRGRALRLLLTLYERRRAIGHLRAG